jgi:16S rRNA (uracil1498-N3)-methyltransferase
VPEVIRRAHTPQLRTGEIELDAQSSHHVRDVLRLKSGTVIEVFDDAGAVAQGSIVRLDPCVVVKIEQIMQPSPVAIELTVASAIPKGERADWMIEKLSELGVWRFIPLHASRSIVLPQGSSKRQRWERLANESARQSRRAGVMQIDPLTSLDELLKSHSPTPDAARTAFFLSTDPHAEPILPALGANHSRKLLLLIGPEGGWTDDEIQRFAKAGMTGLKLTSTILRIETAAVASASVVLCWAAAVAFNPDGES